ncbi:MAG: hypothetical protein IJ899_18410 [Blautia sp.]|nr:hypothetical protein [Blautia sp.]
MPRDKTAAYERIIRMPVSPAWAFPVVVIVGIILSVWIANISMKKHKAVEKASGDEA